MVVASSSMRLRLGMMLWMCILSEVCWLCRCCCFVASSSSSSSSLPPVCPSHPSSHSKIPPFLVTFLSQCHLSFYHHLSPPLEMNGNFLEITLSSKSGDAYTAVLFYDSWCPFSWNARWMFEVLGSMYPKIDHLAVERSSAMPSLFSSYGIHSLPAILIVNQTSRMRFHGSNDLESLTKFYKKTTGHEPVQHIAVDQSDSLGSGGKSIVLPWIGLSPYQILTKEPYLSFSMLFLCLRVMVYIFPRVLFYSRTLWLSFSPHLNLEIFGETSQNLGRIIHMIDVQRIWTKVILCKSRNFIRGARNAKVLASVSLGETSTSRL